ncbi:MAG: hypothetical protein J1F16_06115 [Muribaculaceae bacterium]|nr:hypothetical protein [Muribaculaceae bacterium]
MVKEIDIQGFKCCCVAKEGSHVVTYMIYPALVPMNESWLEKMSASYNVNVVMVYVPADEWNDVLTPWPEPGESKGFPPFAGKASDFLNLLKNDILPKCEKTLEVGENIERDLIGVSLSGLFTLWEWLQCDTFRNIGSLSGSFWYKGFIEWFEKEAIPEKKGKAFFLLGTEEPKAKIIAYQSVGKCTEEIVEKLKSCGITTQFEWVPGNHFSRPVHRAEQAFMGLYKS